MGKTVPRAVVLVQAVLILVLISSRFKADTGACGGVTTTLPFTDVMSSVFFCQIAEAYFSGLTNGTSATTYSPSVNVSREQMAAFITRTQDSALRRGSRRAALKQWATAAVGARVIGRTLLPGDPSTRGIGRRRSVGRREQAGTVTRVRASDGKLLETWTGASKAFGVLVAGGRVYVTGFTSPGRLYVIDPTAPAGPINYCPAARWAIWPAV